MRSRMINIGPQLNHLIEADDVKFGPLVRRLLAAHYRRPDLADEIPKPGRKRKKRRAVRG